MLLECFCASHQPHNTCTFETGMLHRKKTNSKGREIETHVGMEILNGLSKKKYMTVGCFLYIYWCKDRFVSLVNTYEPIHQ